MCDLLPSREVMDMHMCRYAHVHMVQSSVIRTHKTMYKYTRGEIQYMVNYA